MVFISIYDILNSIDNRLEKNVKIYDNSFIDNFIDELKGKIERPVNNSIYTIDRFEGDFAVCEDNINGKFVNVSKDLIKGLATEGDMLRLENGVYVVDKNETFKQKERIESKVEDLWK